MMIVRGYDDDLAKIVELLNRSVPSGAPAPSRPAEEIAGPALAHLRDLDALLEVAARRNASDLLLVAGSPPAYRVQGVLTLAAAAPLEAEDTRRLLLPLLSKTQLEELSRQKSLDFCFERASLRFRANLHYQRGTLAANLRLLPARIPTLESLNLPPALARLTERRQGLVLVTGPTGCGKTSTLAALIDRINARRRDHIITIEDPIEFQHPNRLSLIEQIEIGHDAPSFAAALRSILRQNPDVILVGEMRDAETMATVLTAAETGHLVFSTLHTNDATQAMARILDAFPAQLQPQIRQQLSLALLAVIAQQLVPAADGVGRYPAVEFMLATHAVRNLIRKGDDHQLRSQISIGRAEGMMTMEQSLAELVRAGRISRETAAAHCFRPDDLSRYLEA